MQGPGSLGVVSQVIIGGGGNVTGLFLYSGAPAHGNPPVLAAVPPGVTSDPFGNTVKAVLNIGSLSTSHVGWDAQGNTYLSGPDGKTRVFMANGSIPTGPNNNMDPAIWFFNDFGAAVLVVDPQAGGIFQYEDNGSATQGVVIGSQTFKSGGATDPVNNTSVPAGVFLNDPVFSDSIQIVGGNINWNLAPFSKEANDTINQGSGSTSPYRHIAAPEQNSQVGHAVQRWYGKSVDGTVPPGSVISSTDPPVRATAAMLEVQGTLALLSETAPASVTNYSQPFDSGGLFKSVNGNDGNTYNCERLTKVLASTFTINSTTAQTILSVPVGIGTYDIEVWLVVENATTGDAAAFAFSGPAAAAGPQLMEFEDASSGTATIGYGASSTYTTSFNAQGTAAAANQRIHMRATVQFTAAGTLAITGKEIVSGNTVSVLAGSRMRVLPV